MKQRILYFIFMSLAGFLNSQNTGYLGKKFLLKTNLVNGRQMPVNSVDIEYVTSRRTSVNFSFNHFDYSITNSIRANTGKIKPGGAYDGQAKEFSTLKSGTTSGNMLGLSFKFYFNRIIPAPFGFYMETGVGIGKATLENFSVSYEYKKDKYSQNQLHIRPDTSVASGECKVLLIELPSLGYQRIFKKVVTLDTKVALQTRLCDIPENLLTTFEYNYYVRANTITFSRNANVSIGLAIFVKIGFLIF